MGQGLCWDGGTRFILRWRGRVYAGMVMQGLWWDGEVRFMLGWWGKVYAGMMGQGLC